MKDFVYEDKIVFIYVWKIGKKNIEEKEIRNL